jgi:sugar lactone lactonase YvrE
MKTINTLLVCFILSASLQAQTVSTVTEGEFTDGPAVNSQGLVYGSNFNGPEVFVYDPAGTVSVFATGFTRPNGLAIGDQDEVFICESGADIIHRYATDGTLIETFPGLSNPTGIGYNASENLMYWVSYNGSSLHTLDPDTGTVIDLFAGAPLNGPTGVTISEDVIYLSNYNDRKIFRLETDNTLTEIAQLPSIGPSATDFLGFITSKDGQLYGTHIGAQQIFKIDPISGVVIAFAGIQGTSGQVDGDLSIATFFQPNGIASDPINDKLYITEFGTGNLRIINDVSLSVDAFAKAQLQLNLYPNPTKYSLTVSAPVTMEGKYTLEVYDTKGALVHQMKGTLLESTFSKNINTSSWNNGTYIVVLTTNSQVLTGKLIK